MKKHGITDLARLFGVTPEALRQYEEKEIIAFDRKEGNGYRECSGWEISTLIRARSYKQMGFPLKDVSSLLGGVLPEDLPELFSRQQEILAQEILEREQKIRRLNRLKEEMDSCRALIGRYGMEYRPTLYYLPLLDGTSHFLDEKTWAYMKKQADYLYLVSHGTLYHLDADEKTFVYDSSGLYFDPAQVNYTVEKPEVCTLYPSRLCVTTAFEGVYSRPLAQEDLGKNLEYIRSRGMHITGEIIVQILFSTKIDGEYHFWHKLWFPVDDGQNNLKGI